MYTAHNNRREKKEKKAQQCGVDDWEMGANMPAKIKAKPKRGKIRNGVQKIRWFTLAVAYAGAGSRRATMRNKS